MHDVIALLGYEFARNALIAGMLASVLSGLMGTFVVVKRLVFIAGGIAHAAFAGLGLCYFLGYPPLLGALAVAVLAALILGTVGRNRSEDTLIGMLWAVGMAVGIIFIAKTPGYAPNLMSYLFGDILSVSALDLELLGGFVAIVVVFVALFYKEFVAIAFDDVFAQVAGVRVRVLYPLLLILIAVSVILLIQVVGVILVIALFTIPPVIALGLRTSFLSVAMVAVAVSAVVTGGGLAASYWLDVPSGPAIILLGFGVLLAVRLGMGLRRGR